MRGQDEKAVLTRGQSCSCSAGTRRRRFSVGIRDTAAGGTTSRLVLLLVRRPGWEAYLPRYLEPWIRCGARDYHVILPEEDGSLDEGRIGGLLRQATGIFIGGGHTATYHRYYAQGQIATTIRERYRAGVPVGGSSAGALLVPEICRMSPWDTDSGRAETLPGLGLLADCLVSVHFKSREDEPNIVRAMVETGTRVAWGIDDNACAVFRADKFVRAFGEGVYRVEFDDRFGQYSVRDFSSAGSGA